MSVLRAGIVGLGAMGTNHARVLGNLEGVHVVGGYDPIAEQAGFPFPIFRSMEQLLDQDLDYCVVAVPTSSHVEIALELVEARVPTLIEKPISLDLVSAQLLVDAFSSADVVAGVGHVERYNSAFREAQRRIDSGELGDLVQFSSVRQGPFPGRLQDVGVALDLATHDVDLAAWMTRSKYYRIAAFRAQLPDHEHEDLLVMSGVMENGILVNHLINWLSPKKERKTLITGTRGVFQIDTLSSDLTFYANGRVPSEWTHVAQFRGISQGNIIQYAFPKREPLLLEHEAFRDAVKGLDSPIVTLKDAMDSLGVVLSGLESARLGSVIEFANQGGDL